MDQVKPKQITIDETDLLILQLLYDQDYGDRKGQPRYSLVELNEAIVRFTSLATIHYRLTKLENAGYIHQPGHKVPRSRTITDEGIRKLKNELGLPTTGRT